MNWLEKIDFMIAADKSGEYTGKLLIDITVTKNKWQPYELENIIKSYPWLPKEYINFIKKYDNIGIAWVVFYGSEAGDIIPLGKEIEELREYGLSKDYFPFGKGPGGEVYAFNKKGEVIYFASDDYEFENPHIIAKDFDDFMNNRLFKDRIANCESSKSTSFYEFLKLQGWV